MIGQHAELDDVIELAEKLDHMSARLGELERLQRGVIEVTATGDNTVPLNGAPTVLDAITPVSSGDVCAVWVSGQTAIILGPVAVGGARMCLLTSTSATLTTTEANAESSWDADADPEGWADASGITPTIEGWYQIDAGLYADDARTGEWFMQIELAGTPAKGMTYRDDSDSPRRVAATLSGLVYVDGVEQIRLVVRHFFTNSADVNCDARLSAHLVRAA